MAKVTDLAAITALTTDDLLMAVDAPGTSPASKKITLANLQASITATGTGALGLLTSGTGNTAHGASALAAVVTASNNTAVGFNALKLETGTGNTAVGYGSLVASTSGAYNVGIGFSALGADGIGGYNTAVGTSAAASNTSGSYNVGIGVNALYNNTTAADTVAIGSASLYSANGANNVAVGTDSGRHITGGAANATPSNSVFLGHDTRAAADGETNQIVIGQGAIGAGSNSVTIGNASVTKTILHGAITTGSYERHVQIVAKVDGTVSNQPTPVDFGTVGGLQFATTGVKNAFCQFEVPNDWDGANMYFEVDWFPDSGAMSGTDTIQWVITYRSIAEGESCQLGTVETLTSTDSADYAQYVTKHARVTIPFNDANQPLTKQDHVYLAITRNTGVANDFGGSVTVPAFELIYNAVGIPTT